MQQMLLLWRALAKANALEFKWDRARRPELPNDVQAYFEATDTGPGIWKWMHYFDVYERHFSRFRGEEINLCEIGVYSGGSLGMWKAYFGPKCRVYGVDIEESCKSYEGDGVEVFIGDQADRSFWRRVKEHAPKIDIIIDDGGHQSNQQAITLEEMLPHLQPGGVYLCEDIHGTFNNFNFYLSGLSWNLHACRMSEDVDNHERRLASKASVFQSAIHSIHLYPFLAVIERRNAAVPEFIAPKRGTEWKPFLK